MVKNSTTSKPSLVTMTASKRKKDRVNKLNKKFFSQGSSADTSPGICTCCIQRNHNHKIDFSDDAKLSSREDLGMQLAP